jgi:hypothetical protein
MGTPGRFFAFALVAGALVCFNQLEPATGATYVVGSKQDPRA